MKQTITNECRDRIEQKLKYQNERREERRKKLGVDEKVLTPCRLDLEMKRDFKEAIKDLLFKDSE